MEYLVVKWLHILSSTLLFGTGIGSAFHMLLASFSRDTRAIAVVTRQVVIADWLFTTPTIVIQPLTGLYLMHLAGIPWSGKWIVWSFVLYFIALVCWLPVVAIQIRMHRIAADAVRTGKALPEAWSRCLRWWVLLGIPAFIALTIVFWLMVTKPA